MSNRTSHSGHWDEIREESLVFNELLVTRKFNDMEAGNAPTIPPQVLKQVEKAQVHEMSTEL